METIFLVVCIGLGVGATAWVWWYENGPEKKTPRIEQKESPESGKQPDHKEEG